MRTLALTLLASSAPAFAEDAAPAEDVAAQADDDKSGDTEAVACVRAKIRDAYGAGWSLRTMSSAELELGGKNTWKVTMYPGRQYRFMGCGQTGVENLDLVLYDGSGRVVTRDITDNREPDVVYATPNIGAFYLVAHARAVADPETPVEVAIAITHR